MGTSCKSKKYLQLSLSCATSVWHEERCSKNFLKAYSVIIFLEKPEIGVTSNSCKKKEIQSLQMMQANAFTEKLLSQIFQD